MNDSRAESLQKERDVALRPEHKLILGCAHTMIGPEGSEGIRALLGPGGIDWKCLIRTALHHGVAPLVYRSLRQTCPDMVPEPALASLRSHFQTVACRNLVLTNALVKLVKRLEAEGVSAVPFKGPALAVAAYGHWALRDFCDLDILVHERDLFAAGEVLRAHGYQSKVALTRAQRAAALQFHYHHQYLREDGRVLVELHHQVLEWFFPQEAAPLLWRNLETLELEGTPVPSLTPEDTLQVLCVHGTKHFWSRLKWVCDVAELIRARPEMDWQRACERADALGTERALFLGLFLAGNLLGASIPGTISRRLGENQAIASLAAEVTGELFSESERFSGTLAGTRFRLKTLGSWRQRARYCFRVAIFRSIIYWGAFRPLPDWLALAYRLPACARGGKARIGLLLPVALLSALYYLLLPLAKIAQKCSHSFCKLPSLLRSRHPSNTFVLPQRRGLPVPQPPARQLAGPPGP